MDNISLVTFIRELPLDKIVSFFEEYYEDEISEMEEAQMESDRTGWDCADFDQDGVAVDVLYYNLVLTLVFQGDESALSAFDEDDFCDGEELLYDRLLESDSVNEIGNNFTWHAYSDPDDGIYSFRV